MNAEDPKAGIENLKPCESVVYVHVLVGGPEDGGTLPEDKRYDVIERNGSVYEDAGEEALPVETDWQAINCTDAYVEYVFRRVTMKYLWSAKESSCKK